VNAKNPLISLRLARQHLEPEVLAEHLEVIGRHRGACDEVWLGTVMGVPPLEVHREHAGRMAETAARFREAGVVASLQISNTVGHGPHHRFYDCRGMTWGAFTGPDGATVENCSCPRDPDFLAYLDAMARAYCAWRPERLWIDDDLRMSHHGPARFGCFCERCLALFGEKAGRKRSREELLRATNGDNDLETRAAWLAFTRESLAGVARTVGGAAVAVAPECRLGFQHVDLAGFGYDGPDWHHVFEALHAESGRPVGSRPGNGFYNDHAPRGMLVKGLMVSLQNQRLPDCVNAVSYECENLPGSVLGKSARGTAVECTLALAQGCDGLSLTSLQFSHEHEWHERMLAAFESWRPFWERYVAANAGTRNTGVEIVLSPRQAVRAAEPGERPFAWASTTYGGLFAGTSALGLPLCWNPEAPAALLCAEAARGVDADDLRRLLARGLVLEGEALEVLERRGLAGALGLRYGPPEKTFNFLKLSEDAANGAHAGTRLDCCGYMFGFAPARSFEVLRGSARVLGRYMHADGTEAGAEAVLVEHGDGGRLAVFGWGVSSAIATSGRRQQILAAADWVARGRLPVLLATPCQVAVVPRCDAGGELVTVLLLNVSLDATPPLEVSLRGAGSAGDWVWMRPEERDLELPAGHDVALPSLPPWGVGVLVASRTRRPVR
jgi:hypothetical protein